MWNGVSITFEPIRINSTKRLRMIYKVVCKDVGRMVCVFIASWPETFCLEWKWKSSHWLYPFYRVYMVFSILSMGSKMLNASQHSQIMEPQGIFLRLIGMLYWNSSNNEEYLDSLRLLHTIIDSKMCTNYIYLMSMSLYMPNAKRKRTNERTSLIRKSPIEMNIYTKQKIRRL